MGCGLASFTVTAPRQHGTHIDRHRQAPSSLGRRQSRGKATGQGETNSRVIAAVGPRSVLPFAAEGDPGGTAGIGGQAADC